MLWLSYVNSAYIFQNSSLFFVFLKCKKYLFTMLLNSLWLFFFCCWCRNTFQQILSIYHGYFFSHAEIIYSHNLNLPWLLFFTRRNNILSQSQFTVVTFFSHAEIIYSHNLNLPWLLFFSRRNDILSQSQFTVVTFFSHAEIIYCHNLNLPWLLFFHMQK